MTRFATILAVTALAFSGATAASAETRAEKGEARLAKIIEGRTAGEPVSCISTFRDNRLQVIDRVGLVYDAGDTVYVARAQNPEALGPHDVLVIDRFSSQLCKQDIMRTVDRHAGHFSGVVSIDGFVPYRKNG